MNRAPMLVVLGAATADLAFEQSLAPALPLIQAEYDASPTSVAWVVTAFVLAAVLAIALAGPIGNRVGRRRAFVASLGLFTVGAVVAALAESIGMLIAGRAIQGLGAGMAPLALAILKEHQPAALVPRGVGILLGSAGMGAVLGLIATGVLAEEVSLASVFWAHALVAALIAISALRVVPRSPIFVRERFDWQAGVLLAGGLVALMVAISQGNEWGWSSPAVLALIAASAFVILAWVARERAAPVPLVGVPLMRRRTIWTACAAGFGIALVFYVPFVLVPFIAGYPEATGYGLGLDSTEIALMLTPASLALFVSGSLGGQLVTVIGARLQAVLAGACLSLSFLLLLVLPSTVAGLTAALLPTGVAAGLGFGAIISLILRGSDQEEVGLTSSLWGVIRMVGQALGPQVAVAVVVAAPQLAPGVPNFDGFEDAFVLGLVAAIAATAAAWIVPPAADDPLIRISSRQDERRAEATTIAQ
jgi:MFS family permease